VKILQRSTLERRFGEEIMSLLWVGRASWAGRAGKEDAGRVQMHCADTVNGLPTWWQGPAQDLGRTGT
jgi:hypothetical protein